MISLVDVDIFLVFWFRYSKSFLVRLRGQSQFSYFHLIIVQNIQRIQLSVFKTRNMQHFSMYAPGI